MTDPTVTLLVGDVRERLAQLPDESVHCVVTSPPYWGLRDYDVPGQLGLEPTLGEHIETMVDIFREIRRVLRRDGTCWINYGDCYATKPNGRPAAKITGDDRAFRDKPFSTVGPIYSHGAGVRGVFPRGAGARRGGGNNPAGGVLKPKDLCMVPNRLAIALQDDGWWVRSEIIWHKPNPMPDSASDRPGTAHEKIWLLTKSERYWYDAGAVRRSTKRDETFPVTGWATGGGDHSAVTHNTHKTRGNGTGVGWGRLDRLLPGQRDRGRDRVHTPKHQGHINHTGLDETPRGSANLRNVWTMATRPFTAAHFATFPPELPEICIRAGCPVGGMVLDPFGGAGTTGLVAAKLLRNAVLIELKPDYVAITLNRLRSELVHVQLDGMAEPVPDPLFQVAAE